MAIEFALSAEIGHFSITCAITAMGQDRKQLTSNVSFRKVPIAVIREYDANGDLAPIPLKKSGLKDRRGGNRPSSPARISLAKLRRFGPLLQGRISSREPFGSRSSQPIELQDAS
jgi:hypothetical protein